MVAEDVLFFGASYGTIQDHLLAYHKDNTNYLKDK